ncbi:MAG: hypothetical protein IGR93_17405 [Hydrococcus sp. C42_A2020_068]|uniref:hypothetical protein n=1 Tax=Pleurocapsa sp. PCC 7327 TaxID=118163 RepID=UPI00029FB399|nr:hypothetical protein [Pleurocapsa sp. PCC 7327]AFY75945.1 hypothetical protein Ple7327_0496 [Pleurocapsa sp. PCC 7327]MBF2021816.1 hypothetical protein [Hydrococcus sp. C42_A2020_068]
MSWQVSESVTFEDAIALTESLLEQMSAGQLEDREIQAAITDLVKTENGARGFFVTYLTDNRPLADNPATGVIEALKSSPEIVSELLVKNLAMSSAMVIAHRRNNDEENAKGSNRVRQRTANLIQQIKSDLVAKKLKELHESAATGEGNYKAFLQRWGYDDEQKQVIQKAISEVCDRN